MPCGLTQTGDSSLRAPAGGVLGSLVPFFPERSQLLPFRNEDAHCSAAASIHELRKWALAPVSENWT